MDAASPQRRVLAWRVELSDLGAGDAWVRAAIAAARQRGAGLLAIDAGSDVPELLDNLKLLDSWAHTAARARLGLGVRIDATSRPPEQARRPWLALVDSGLSEADDRATLAVWSAARLSRVGLARWPDRDPAADAPLRWKGDLQVDWHPASPRATRPRSAADQSARLEPVSNQFDLVRSRPAFGPDSPLPPARAARVVWVDLPGEPEPACFELIGESLDDAEVAHALAHLQQLYLDVSAKARLDDFDADLRALRRARPPRPVDGGVVPSRWSVSPAPPFAAAEDALRSVLVALEGLVVDIGAGPLRYVRMLDAAARQGRLRYVAVEPDAAHLDGLRGAVHGGVLVRGVGEALPLPDASANAVMFLRSWNHLSDVDSAVAAAARALRPGGVLIAVDNVAFGLLRTPEQLRRAHAVPVSETPFEHYRNANADHCVDSLQAHGVFDIERVDAVAPGRANQWLVVARRRAP